MPDSPPWLMHLTDTAHQVVATITIHSVYYYVEADHTWVDIQWLNTSGSILEDHWEKWIPSSSLG